MLKIIQKRGRHCVKYEGKQYKFLTREEALKFISSKTPVKEIFQEELPFEATKFEELSGWKEE